MELSNHALARKQQRGFSNDIIDVIQSYGRVNKAPGGAVKIFFGKKEGGQAIIELHKMIKLIERSIGGAMIMSNTDKVITMYKSKSP